MAQYIDKSIIDEELKRRIQESLDAGGATRGVYLSERMKEDSYILSFIDTLEVKEVDIEKEISIWWNNFYSKLVEDNYTFEGYSGHYLENSTVISLAKYFFELGLNTQKENKNGSTRQDMD